MNFQIVSPPFLSKRIMINHKLLLFNRSPAPNGSCSFRVMLNWLSRKDKSCSPFGHCCPGGQNFSFPQMKCVNPEDRGDQRPELNDTKCEDDDHVYCQRQHVCLPKQTNCTKPTRFDFFSVSQFANRSGMLINLFVSLFINY